MPRETSRQRPSPGNHPRRGQDPSLRTEPFTGVRATPRAGHARPLPRGGPETGAHVNPAGVSISPSVGRGAPTPPRPPAAAHSPGKPQGAASPTPRGGFRCRQQQPLPSPSGEGGPAGPDEGQASVTAHSRANRRGGVPDAPRRLPPPPIPRVITRGDSRCRQHPRRGQDPSLRTEPLTGVRVNPRAGHARPLPRNNPTHLYTT